ncbi:MULTISPECIES: VOC family protein [Burkholderia]|nr:MULTISPECIES: VOC family protein [Burkholderia]
MMIGGIFHCAIRTADLDATLLFYKGALGLKEVPRPAGLKFPGAWLAVPNAIGQPILHVYAGYAAADGRGEIPTDNERGAVDHISLLAHGFTHYRAHFEKLGISAREQNQNGGSNWQMFVHDPNGIKIELTFDQAAEPDLPVPIADARRYDASERFFDAREYLALKEKIALSANDAT